ncbi:unnamed protein product [Allacma fusca]|uniref:CRAL-TRIO domain-containing protein n=1 Tax=Allacma fusca TaxID=39272 RepID=A0A8J2PMI8_9HEXA|nr:unnamed protein product [Allacma fusca]
MFKIFITFIIFTRSCWAANESPNGAQGVIPNSTKLPEKVYSNVYNIMKYSKSYSNMTFEEVKNFLNDVEDWKAPENISKRFPYYLTGFDFEDRPIWVCEYGKYQWDDLMERNSTELMIVTEKLLRKVVLNVFKSLAQKETPDRTVRQAVLVIDYEGFNMKQMTTVFSHPEIIEFIIRKSDEYRDILVAIIGEIVLINANFAVAKGIDFIRPFVGELLERLTILGANKYKWKAELRRLIPANFIPPWYGGSKDFKPLAVFA